MIPDSAQLLTRLLKDVSRSFYTTLRVLPAGVRPQIGLAYLLARATDTIADTTIVPVAYRLEALRWLRDRILGRPASPLDIARLAEGQAASAERRLLERMEEALSLLTSFSAFDQEIIREVLATITSGQELDLVRFGESGERNMAILLTDPDLEDYTYRVAGCVGEFWTKLCRTHLFPKAELDQEQLIADGVRFGKGLQLVNILRDLPSDLRQGRCYLPQEKLAPLGLMPSDLLNPQSESRLRPLYNAYLDRAQAYLEAGWNYTMTIPRSCVRLRLACAWPVLIGVRTLGRLRVEHVLDATRRIKVSRREVRGIIARSLLSYPFEARWRNLFVAASRVETQT